MFIYSGCEFIPSIHVVPVNFICDGGHVNPLIRNTNKIKNITKTQIDLTDPKDHIWLIDRQNVNHLQLCGPDDNQDTSF